MKRGNYPLIYALEMCSSQDRATCVEALNNHEWNTVLKLIDQSFAIDHTMQLAQKYAESAKETLDQTEFKNKSILKQESDGNERIK